MIIDGTARLAACHLLGIFLGDLLAHATGVKTNVGKVCGVSAGLAATDRKLVPYGALVAPFQAGLGCLMGPSVLLRATRALVG
jgi:malonate transporter MadL subunit